MSQAIPIGLLPVLTRIYTPEEFGLLAIFLALFSILSVFVTGRYEMAIMLPYEEKDSLSLFQLSILFSFFFSSVIATFIFFFSDEIAIFFQNEELGFWLYFLPLSILIAGIFQTFNYWLNKNKKFNSIAMGKIVLGTGTGTFQLIIRLFSKISGGLIIGYIIGQLASIFYFYRQIFFQDSSKFLKISKDRLYRNAIHYKRFPLISSVTSILDRSAVQMPVLMLSKFFDQASTGIFSTLTRFLDAPFAVLNSSIALVLHQRVVAISKERPEELSTLIIKIYFSLLVLTLPFIIVIYFYGSEIFAILLGKSWGEVGNLSFLIAVVVGYRFCVSPLSSVLSLRDTLHLGAYWQTIYFFTISTTLFLVRNLELIDFLFIFMVHELILYSLYLCFILYGCKYNDK